MFLHQQFHDLKLWNLKTWNLDSPPVLRFKRHSQYDSSRLAFWKLSATVFLSVGQMTLYRSKPPLSKATLVDIPWGPERLFRPLLPGRQHWFTKTKSTTILWRAMLPGRQHCYSQRRQAAGDELGLVTSQATMINHCCLTGYIASYLLSLWIPMLPAR